MKQKKIWIAVIIVIIIAGLFGLNIWSNAAEHNHSVEVTTLKEENMTNKVLTQGTLKLSDEQTIYYSPEKGEIAEILVSEGDAVEEGTPLLRYENEQLKLEQEQNKLQLESAYLQVNDLKEKHRDLDEQLEKDKKNEMLQTEHDQVKLQEQQANIEIKQLQLQKESIEKQLKDLEVTSEITGTVLEVNEQATSSNQTEQVSLIRIASLNQLVVEGSISEYDTLSIEEGQTVNLTADAVPDKSWTGTVNHIAYLPEESGGMDMGNNTTTVQYPISVTVENKDVQLKPGFQMVVEITTDEFTAKTLPLSTVKQDSDINYVYIVNDGKVEKRKVTVGTTSVDFIEITDGLDVEDQVIINPNENITEGMEVTVS
ncbi:efflux RND transporter periplasmic adaptor subunit [Oceanobacillus halophilus]|uniref:Efflux RND transporter periplasmic adaptor subunit n=1 Tax=Oceanobacillus halophilus TaxID=930130 RepID=A0A494ZRA0_9BACI|nr:efflux RND transporter periplasmic adaptor subunit [Oceanobacillus halophilus]RKQ28207.1 efflux RND transporter periplasmic adaptor subunit [Oceanobacillus halophilus]